MHVCISVCTAYELYQYPVSQSCENALAKAAGTDCLVSLTEQLGRMIMRGRVEQHNLE